MNSKFQGSKILWTKNSFGTKIFFDPKFSRSKFFFTQDLAQHVLDTKNFCTKIFLASHFLDLKWFCTDIFGLPFFGTWIFSPKFFWLNFFGQYFFWTQFSLDKWFFLNYRLTFFFSYFKFFYQYFLYPICFNLMCFWGTKHENYPEWKVKS